MFPETRVSYMWLCMHEYDYLKEDPLLIDIFAYL